MKTLRMAGTFLLAILGLVLLIGLFAKPEQTVRGKSASRPLTNELTPEQTIAQEAALLHPEVRERTRGQRTEVFGVQAVGHHYTAAASECANANCQQVNIYNFDKNESITVIVNVDTGVVLDVLFTAGMQPGINKRLADLALELAVNHPEVHERLGFVPTHADMAPMIGGGDSSGCPDGHLCIIPTFELRDENRVLWVFVDLTDEKVVGTSWTTMDPNDMPVETLFPSGCPPSGSTAQDGWTVDYEVTGSDGLRVFNVSYNGLPVMTSGKLVEWHVDYNSGAAGFVDVTGCTGGGGFPIYPYGNTQVNSFSDIENGSGFEVVQDFRMLNWGQTCNYRYEQHWQFFNDGRFRVVSGAFGKGCNYNGGNSVYRPVLRLDLAVNGDPEDTFSRWDGAAWQEITTEDYFVPYEETGHGPHQINPDGYSWRVMDSSGIGYNIIQDVGQFERLERGSSPFWYVTQHHPNEGDTDMGSFGSCCNDDHHQGPEQYINGESTASQNIVLWYVPQNVTQVTDPYYCWTLQGEPNPETYPCFSGPMFVPTSMPVQASFVTEGALLLSETAVFTNTTTGTEPISYTWDFGDNSPISVMENPTHTYTSIGNYTVTLTATNEINTDTYQAMIEVLESPVLPTAAFTTTLQNYVTFPVTFTNQSTGPDIKVYEWDFGDGSPLSTEVSPTHVYTLPMTYTVTLSATNRFGTDAVMQPVVVQPLDDTFIPSIFNSSAP